VYENNGANDGDENNDKASKSIRVNKINMYKVERE
jgi:hypothetical protein